MGLKSFMLLTEECVVREFDKNVVELFNKDKEAWNYYVLYSDLKTRRGLLRVLYFLSCKPWITPVHIKQLLEIAHKKAGHSIVSPERH